MTWQNKVSRTLLRCFSFVGIMLAEFETVKNRILVSKILPMRALDLNFTVGTRANLVMGSTFGSETGHKFLG